MENSQYKLCLEILRRFEKAGILKDIVLIGSWCMLFYERHSKSASYMPLLKTRDMDLLVPHPAAIKAKVDVSELLKELGFVVGFTGTAGYIRLEHPELIVEFLVPERGKGSVKPYPLPQFGINAQALRFMDFLVRDTITAKIEEISLTVPSPANFCLHKLIIASRRRKTEKALKDLQQAIYVSGIANDQQVKNLFDSMPKKWKQTILKMLEKAKKELPLLTEDIDKLELTLQTASKESM